MSGTRATLMVVAMAGFTTLGCGGDSGGGPAGPDSEQNRGGSSGSRTGGASGTPSGTGGSSSGAAGSPGAGGAPASGAGGGAAPGSGGSGAGGSGPAPDGGGTPTEGGSAPNPMPGNPTGDDWSFLAKPVPILWFTVNGAAIAPPGRPKAERTAGNLKVIYDHDGASMLTSIAGKTVALDSPILIEHRGNSSSSFYAQKPYGFEFVDAMRQPTGQVLHGMPKNADWALVSCYSDKTCLRNSITYAVGRELVVPSGRWAPRSRWAEVYIDGRYQGLYQLSEKVKDDKFRVNLPKPAAGAAPSELGFMIAADGDSRSLAWRALNPTTEFLDSRARASQTNNRRWRFRAPNAEDLTPAQRTYIQGAFDKLTSTLEGGGDWKSAIDVGSFVDYLLIAELTNNVDAFFKSWYFYKMPDSMGGKWSMGPMWDFDLGYGNSNYYLRHCATNTQIGPLAKTTPGGDKDLPPPPYIAAVVRDQAVKNELRCRYHGLRKAGGPLDITLLEARLDAFVAHIKAAKARDLARWRNIPKHVWPNNYVGGSWDDEVKYLKFWIRKRLAWMDASLPGTCTTTPAGAAITPITAPPAVQVTRPEAYGGESAIRHSDYVDIDAATPAQWSCPR